MPVIASEIEKKIVLRILDSLPEKYKKRPWKIKRTKNPHEQDLKQPSKYPKQVLALSGAMQGVFLETHLEDGKKTKNRMIDFEGNVYYFTGDEEKCNFSLFHSWIIQSYQKPFVYDNKTLHQNFSAGNEEEREKKRWQSKGACSVRMTNPVDQKNSMVAKTIEWQDSLGGINWVRAYTLWECDKNNEFGIETTYIERRIYKGFTTIGKITLFSPYLGRSLEDAVDLPLDIYFEFILNSMEQVAKLHNGTLSRHGMPYVHSDIKPGNLVFDENYNVRLIDFGFAYPIPLGYHLGPLQGSRGYFAPETFYSDSSTIKYSFTTDLYGLGGVCRFLLIQALKAVNIQLSQTLKTNLDTLQKLRRVFGGPVTEPVKAYIVRMSVYESLKGISLSFGMDAGWFELDNLTQLAINDVISGVLSRIDEMESRAITQTYQYLLTTSPQAASQWNQLAAFISRMQASDPKTRPTLAELQENIYKLCSSAKRRAHVISIVEEIRSNLPENPKKHSWELPTTELVKDVKLLPKPSVWFYTTIKLPNGMVLTNGPSPSQNRLINEKREIYYIVGRRANFYMPCRSQWKNNEPIVIHDAAFGVLSPSSSLTVGKVHSKQNEERAPLRKIRENSSYSDTPYHELALSDLSGSSGSQTMTQEDNNSTSSGTVYPNHYRRRDSDDDVEEVRENYKPFQPADNTLIDDLIDAGLESIQHYQDYHQSKRSCCSLLFSFHGSAGIARTNRLKVELLNCKNKETKDIEEVKACYKKFFTQTFMRTSAQAANHNHSYIRFFLASLDEKFQKNSAQKLAFQGIGSAFNMVGINGSLPLTPRTTKEVSTNPNLFYHKEVKSLTQSCIGALGRLSVRH